MEKAPLYVLAHQEKKPLTELLFWYENLLGRFLLVVLADETANWTYPMALVFPESGMVFHTFEMPRTILAELVEEDELDDAVKETISQFRKTV